MCNCKMKSSHAGHLAIDGRQVLQPACNRIVTSEPARPFKKSLQRSLSSPITINDVDTISPMAPKKPIKRGSDPNSLNSSTESKVVTPKLMTRSATAVLVRKKSKKSSEPAAMGNLKNILNSPYEIEQLAPGSIAAAQREQASLAQAQRKMKIAHYGRVAWPGKQPEKSTAPAGNQEEKRCSFITPNSDPLYVAYHDEEWGVPVHNNNMLFELLVLSGLQVGLDWTTILKKRDEFRSAFGGFDAELVGRFTERQIGAISRDYGIDLSRVRGVVDNAYRILEVMKDFGSFDEYLWGFVNGKAIATEYRSGRNKIPVKTSKSETISKDMVRRGFRLVGPTVIHSFMQAAGLTNDHLLSCPRHLHCSTLD